MAEGQLNEFQLRMNLLPIAANIVASRPEDFPISDLILTDGNNKYDQLGEHVRKVTEGILNGSGLFQRVPANEMNIPPGLN